MLFSIIYPTINLLYKMKIVNRAQSSFLVLLPDLLPSHQLQNF